MSALVRGYDVVVAQHLPVPTMRALAQPPTRASTTSTRRSTLEQLALDAREADHAVRELDGAAEQPHPGSRARDRRRVRLREREAARPLARRARGRAAPRPRDATSTTRRCARSSTSSRSASTQSRRAPGPALRGVVPGIGADDRILLWPGGIWNWFDPLTVIRAVHELSQRRDDVRLFFLGAPAPEPGVPEMAMAGARRVALAEELGLRDRVVFFNFGWVPYAERGALPPRGRPRRVRALRRPRDALRVPDAPARLPLGRAPRRHDTRRLARRARRRSGGAAAPSTSATSTAGSARSRRCSTTTPTQRRGERARRPRVRPSFEWPRVVEPLRRLADPGTTRARQRRLAGLRRALEYLWLAAAHRLLRHGLAATATGARSASRRPQRTLEVARWPLGYPRPP